MSFDWTTFALEVLNFFVLVWILKHFFYRPVLAVLDERQARLSAERQQAEQMRNDAVTLKSQYETRLEDWQREREQSRRLLDNELTRARASAMESLKKRLADEEAKARARAEALAASREGTLRREALRDAYRTAAAMLKRLAIPELTERVAEVVRDDLATLPEARRSVLRNAAQALGVGATVDIAVAHRLADPEQALLSNALAQAADRSLAVTFKEAPELIAGVRATVGECLLHANLADELAFFSGDDPHG